MHTPNAYLLVNAWYTGGADVIDFNNPRQPFEATFEKMALARAEAGGLTGGAADSCDEPAGAGRSQVQVLSPRLRVKVQRAHTARSVG